MGLNQATQFFLSPHGGAVPAGSVLDWSKNTALTGFIHNTLVKGDLTVLRHLSCKKRKVTNEQK